MPTRVAVVAGCNYTPAPAAPPTADGTHPPALQFAEADPQAMAALLEDQGFAVTPLIGPAATRENIIDSLRTQSRLARASEDLLVFYFAGHGGPDPDDPHRAYLISADANPDRLPSTALKLADLADEQVAAGRTLTLLDCCYSGAILGVVSRALPTAGAAGGERGQARPADPTAITQDFGRRVRDSFRLQPGRVILTACAGDEQARELAHLQHGVFTYYVLAHWRDDPGEITDLTLVQYVDTELEKARLPRLVRGVTDQGRLVLRAPRPSVFAVPYPRNPLFVGRDDVLADLAARLGGSLTPVLAGLGGQGKTQIAVELAYRLRERYPGGVFWLTMDAEAGMRSQVAAFAGPTVLALPGYDTRTFDERVAAVCRAWEESVPRLLIFDNLEDPELLHWRPRLGDSHVLVTSRNAEWSALDGVDLLLLEALPRPLSVELLLTPRAHHRQTTVPALLATVGTASAADTICEALADLPLALTLAAAHLEQRDRRSVARYSDQLQQQPVTDESLNAEFTGKLPTGHAPSILATFALSYDQLDPNQSMDALALTILHRAAHAAAAPIPADLLVRLTDRDPADEDTADDVDQAVQRLAALGLVERLPDGSARLHRLLAAYARHRAPAPAADAATLETALSRAASQLHQAGYPHDAQPYLPHLRAATTAASRTDPQAATLFNNLALLLAAQGDYGAARPSTSAPSPSVSRPSAPPTPRRVRFGRTFAVFCPPSHESTQVRAAGSDDCPPGRSVRVPLALARPCVPPPSELYRPSASPLEPVPRRALPVRLPRPLVRRARPVPLQHRPRPPPGQPHQVPLLPPLRQPLVRERVPELVRVKMLQPRLGGAGLDHIAQPPHAQRPMLPQPEQRTLGVRMVSPRPQVAIQRLGRLPPERTDPRPAPLAEHMRHVLLPIQVTHLESGDLAAPHTRIDQQPQNRQIAPAGEILPIARLQKAAQLIFRQHRGRRHRRFRRMHAFHRRHADLPLLHAPPEEGRASAIAGDDRRSLQGPPSAHARAQATP
jgi:hypothetical protein